MDKLMTAELMTPESVLGVTTATMLAMVATAEKHLDDALGEYRAAFPDVPVRTLLALWHVSVKGVIATQDRMARQIEAGQALR